MAPKNAPRRSAPALSTPHSPRSTASSARLDHAPGRRHPPPPVEVIPPTGSVALDAALGVGGLPRGRIVEIYGPESSGKTTVALHAVANAQRNGGIAAFIDAEHALDPEYAKKLGVDTDALLVSQPTRASRRSRSPTC